MLRQLRAGYPERSRRFPRSVVLCGLRDVRDYRIRSGAENAIVAGGIAFNVCAASLRLGDSSRADAESLVAKHTVETSQAFTAEARAAIWGPTQDQPWLMNALVYDACFDNEAGRARGRPMNTAAVQDEREPLIFRRETHLAPLADKLREERVRRGVEPLLSLAGRRASNRSPPTSATSARSIVIANPIHREVIRRVYGRSEPVRALVLTWRA